MKEQSIYTTVRIEVIKSLNDNTILTDLNEEIMKGEFTMSNNTADIEVGYKATIPEVFGKYSSLTAELRVRMHNADVTDGFERAAAALSNRVYAQLGRQLDTGLTKLGVEPVFKKNP